MRQTCVWSADGDVAADDQLTGASPDASFDHGDDWERALTNGADRAFEGVVVGEWIASRLG